MAALSLRRSQDVCRVILIYDYYTFIHRRNIPLHVDNVPRIFLSFRPHDICCIVEVLLTTKTPVFTCSGHCENLRYLQYAGSRQSHRFSWASIRLFRSAFLSRS